MTDSAIFTKILLVFLNVVCVWLSLSAGLYFAGRAEDREKSVFIKFSIILLLLTLTMIVFPSIWLGWVIMGGFLNFIAHSFNQGLMPVMVAPFDVDMSEKVRESAGHQFLTEQTRFKYLCDVVPFLGAMCSIGDIAVLVGYSLCLGTVIVPAIALLACVCLAKIFGLH